MDAPEVTVTTRAEYVEPGLGRGPTPLIELRGLDAGRCRVLAKLEHMNPTGSIKDRVAAAMIMDAERRGVLRPGMTIVEGSSGNATIAMGAVGLRRGYPVLAFVPGSLSQEKRRLHEALGVTCEFFSPDPTRPFTNPRRDAAIDLARTNPDKFCCLDQFSNPMNVRAHEMTTGEEVARQAPKLGHGIDRLFIGAGTGGSLVGLARALRKPDRWPTMGLTMVDPGGSVLGERFRGEPGEARQMRAPDGLGERFVPANLDLSVVDDAVEVERADAVASCGELLRATGILGGPCTGYTLHAALEWCRKQREARTVLVLVCDRGENYLSDEEFAGAMIGAHGSGAGVVV